MNLDNSIEKTLSEIQKVMNTDSIIGSPLTIKDNTIIPISKTALGFGIGLGNHEGDKNTEIGGAGGGGSIDPIAFVVIYDNVPGPNGVEVVPVEGNDTPIEDLLNGLGQFVFDFLSNRNAQPAQDVPNDVDSDDIKTKVKEVPEE